MQSAQFFARTVRQLMQFVLFGWVNSLKWTIEPSVPPADIRHVKSSSQLLLGKKHLTVIKESSGKVCSPQSMKLTFFQIFLWLRLRALETFLASNVLREEKLKLWLCWVPSFLIFCMTLVGEGGTHHSLSSTQLFCSSLASFTSECFFLELKASRNCLPRNQLSGFQKAFWMSYFSCSNY